MKPTKPKNTRTPTSIGRNIDQVGDADLRSDGMKNGSSQPARAQGYGGNQHAGKTDPNKTFNMGRGPTVGMTGKLTEGPAKPPVSSVPDFRAAATRAFAGLLNLGSQVRTPGGTRTWDPKAGQNYSGNPDQITKGRGPTKGNSQ